MSEKENMAGITPPQPDKDWDDLNAVAIECDEDTEDSLYDAPPRSQPEIATGPAHQFKPEEIALNAKMWTVSGKAFFPSEYTTNSLPPGYYTVNHSDRGIYFLQHAMNLDDLLILPDSISEKVIKQIEYFWTREEQFRTLGFLWKRGILLYGPAGGGKTSTLQLISKRIIDRGGLSIYLKNPYYTAQGLEILRRIEPDRPIVVLLEDLDALIKEFGEAEILAILDGEQQIDNVVFIATTNYPETLDRRLKNRPSRFDIVERIGYPSELARQVYFSAKNPRLVDHPRELDKWVDATKGFTIAHLKELILSVEVLDDSFDNALRRLKKMMTANPSSEEDTESNMGFLKHDG